MKKYLIVAGILIVVGAYIASKYNSLVTLTNNADAQWAQVDTVLQRRFDSINQAVGSIKAANKSEQDALQKVTDARKIYTAASGNVEAQVAAANNYGGALNGLLLTRATVQEGYPTLKTPELIGGLVSGVNIEGSENRISVERGRYNEIVKNYNNTVTVFPSNLFAKTFGFTKRSYFELVNTEAKQAPAIGQDLKF